MKMNIFASTLDMYDGKNYTAPIGSDRTPVIYYGSVNTETISKANLLQNSEIQ
jgi:hypothetical protein